MYSLHLVWNPVKYTVSRDWKWVFIRGNRFLRYYTVHWEPAAASKRKLNILCLNLTIKSSLKLLAFALSYLKPHRLATSSGSESLNSQPSPVTRKEDELKCCLWLGQNIVFALGIGSRLPVHEMNCWQDLSVSSSSRNCHSWMGPEPCTTSSHQLPNQIK